MKIKKLRQLMSGENLDSYVSVGSAGYLAETPAATATIVTEETSAVLCSRMDLERARRESQVRDIRSFAKSEVSLRDEERGYFGSWGNVLAGILKDLGVSSAGYDELNGKNIEEVEENSGVELSKHRGMIWDLRKKKNQEEIDKITESAQIASKAMKRAESIINPGVSESTIAAEVEYEMRRLGSSAPAFNTIVASGENSWLPHVDVSDRELREDELIVVDLGAKLGGYSSDMTRTFGIHPTHEQEEIVEAIIEAQEAARDELEAGARAKDVDEAGRRVFRKFGYESYYLHSMGHGVGWDVHEPPRLSPDTNEVLEENMVVTIEPGLYVKGVGGARIEDMFLVKENGYEKLTQDLIFGDL